MKARPKSKPDAAELSVHATAQAVSIKGLVDRGESNRSL
jgi:hypothetical protein